MYDLTTINLYLQYAAIAQFKAADSAAKDNVLQSGITPASKKLPHLLRFCRTVINTAKATDVGTVNMGLMVGYMYSLSSRYVAQAAAVISGSSSGTIIYNPSTGSAAISFPVIQIQVAPGAGIVEGATTYTFAAAGIVSDTINISVDGVILPYNVADRLSYTAVYGASTTTITFNQGAALSQIYRISYEKITTI